MTEPRVGLASSAAGNGLGGAVTPLLVGAGTGRWRRSCSFSPTIGPRRRCRARSRACHRASRVPTPTFSIASATVSAAAAYGPPGSWPSDPSSSVSDPWCSADRLVPGRWRLVGDVLLGERPGLGGIFTGSGTDPNSGPLIVLLALAMVPAVLPVPTSWLSPFSTALFRYPVLVLGSLVALLAGLFLTAAYPVAAQESTSTAMAGMTGMSGATSGFGRHDFDDRHLYSREQRGAEDGAGHPEHTEHGHGWAGHQHEHEQGPMPARGGSTEHHEIELALHRSGIASGRGPGPAGPWRQRVRRHPHGRPKDASPEPTFSQQINSTQYVQATSEAVARYSTPAAAQVAGYEPVSPYRTTRSSTT